MIDEAVRYRLTADHVTVVDEERSVLDNLSLAVPDGKMTAVVGPNGSGTSTLLAALGRRRRPTEGVVLLDGQHIHRLRASEVSSKVGVFPAPFVGEPGASVLDAVRRGRCTDLSQLRVWGPDDDAAVARALDVAGISPLRHRTVSSLSSGDRQRVGVATVLVQSTPIVLLDEPTSHLDVAHQIEVLELLSDLVRRQERTVVVTFRDLNQACRYADHLVVMRHGRIVAEGAPSDVVDREMVRAVFALNVEIVDGPTGRPFLVPSRPRGSYREAAPRQLAGVS